MKAYHTSQLSTLSSQLSSCPQIFTDLLRFFIKTYVVKVVFILNTNCQKWPKIFINTFTQAGMSLPSEELVGGFKLEL